MPSVEGRLVPAGMRRLVEVQAESEEDEPVADDGELVGEEEEPWVSQEREVCRHREWMAGVKIAQTCETAHEG